MRLAQNTRASGATRVEYTIFNASTCGDNCAKWILEIGKQKDLTINLRHMMSFGKDTEFEIRIENGGEIVHSMRELIPVASRYLNQMKQE